MSESTDTKLDPAAETVASSEPQVEKTDTEPTTNPVQGDAANEDSAKEPSAPASVCPCHFAKAMYPIMS